MSFIFVPNEIHIMVDIETLAVSHDAAITEIGAVVIEMLPSEEGLLRYFHEECDDPFGAKDLDTIQWRNDHNLPWHQYPNVPVVGETLNRFFTWVETMGKIANAEPIMWCKGTDFDKKILETAAERNKLMHRIPWKYNKFFDLRTLLKVFPQFKVPRDSVAHNGYKDALQQAEQLVSIDSHIDALQGYYAANYQSKQP